MFNSTEELIEEIRNGKMIVLLDDESRENEGDVVFAGKFATSEKINFLITNCRGLICAPVEDKHLEKLGLSQMTSSNTDPHKTAFTVSIDSAKEISTGISTYDRAVTIQRLSRQDAVNSDFVSPGHMFPLRSKLKGVLEREGHTEAAVDLVKMAGIEPAVGVICEIIKDDGEMARRDDLLEFAKKHNLKIGTIKDLVLYRKINEEKLTMEAETIFPIKNLGEWQLKVFKNNETEKENVVLIKGALNFADSVLTRIHSECFTGDIFGSDKCDCSDQLNKSMELINRIGSGIIIYLRQEGRGIGLINKIKAYELQRQGFDTVDANLELGFESDLREYSEAAEILNKLGVEKVNLITNNRDKINGLLEYGIKVEKQIILNPHVTENNHFYLKTKKERCGHNIEI